MTTKLNPDGPQLELDGEPMEGDVLSDSEWEGLDNTDGKKKATQENLGRIARARRAKQG